MTSGIDPLKPADGVPAVKADLRANLQAAKDEIEALQARQVPTGGGTGHVLTKNSPLDLDFGWSPPPTGSNGLDFLVPEAYGAVANDATPAVAAANQVAFQSLFNDARNNGKSIQFEPARTYYIGDGPSQGAQLSLAQHTDFIILGNGSKLIRGNGVALTAGGSSDPLLAFDRCQRFTVRDLIVDGNRANVAPVDEFGHAIQFWGSRDFWMIACQGNNSQGDGFAVNRDFTLAADSFDGNCKRGRFLDCSADNNNRQGMSLININECDVIGGAYTRSNGAPPCAGIDFEPNPNGATDSVTDVRVVGVHFEGNEGSGIKMVVAESGGDATAWSRHVTVMGCTFFNNATNRDGGSTNPIPQMSITGENTQVIGNIFAGQTNRSATSPFNSVWYVPKYAHGVTVAHNTVFNVPAADCVLSTWHVSQGRLSQVVFRNNVINVRSGLTTGKTGGERIFWVRVPGVDIKNNHVIADPADAHRGVHTTDGADENVIDGNVFEDVQNGASGVILASAGTPLSVSYNLFKMASSSAHTPIAGNTASREEGNFAKNMAAARNGAKTT